MFKEETRAERSPRFSRRVRRSRPRRRRASEKSLELLLLIGPLERLLRCDHAGPNEILERLIHQGHAATPPGLNLRVDHRDLSLANRVGKGRRPEEDLEGDNAPAADLLHQLLSDDGLERLR